MLSVEERNRDNYIIIAAIEVFLRNGTASVDGSRGGCGCDSGGGDGGGGMNV